MNTPLMTRKLPRSLTYFFLIILIVGVGGTGFVAGYKKGNEISGVPPRNILNSENPSISSSTPTNFGLFWQAWNVINDKFYGTAEDSKRVDGAIGGMVASLKDPYTVYLEPSQNKLFRSDLEGSFGGIGAELSVKDGQLTIVSALDGTPAQKSHLQGQDIIVEIDGKKTAEISYGDAINAIRGEKGTQVELTIARAETKDPFKVKLTRETIVVKSVKTDTIGAQKNIAYIKLNQFGDDSSVLLKAAFKDVKANNRKGIVLDLRDNPGGYLETAVDAIGMIIPSKIDSSEPKLKDRDAVLERTKDGKEIVHKATSDPIVSDVPMVVLVNKGSASASEILAGALKDYKRATVLGTKTFGKGSVQELKDLSNGGSIKVTIAKWFTPLGNGIDGKGIEPDQIVELPEKTLTSTSDIQVEKALEILQK